jgi:hypothetical protein
MGKPHSPLLQKKSHCIMLVRLNDISHNIMRYVTAAATVTAIIKKINKKLFCKRPHPNYSK